MATVTKVMALKNFFNEGDGYSVESEGGPNCAPTVAGIPAKRDLKTFTDEIKALSQEEKDALAEGVVAVTGDTLK